MKSSLKKNKRDINWVRNLSEMDKLIKRLLNVGAFGRAWAPKKMGSALSGSHILLMTSEEVITIYGRKEPFNLIHYIVGGSQEISLLRKVSEILAKYDVKISK